VSAKWGLTELFQAWGFSYPGSAEILAALTSAVLLVGFIALAALFFIWLERKVSARIQDRLGPTRVGGYIGWAQSIADGIKLFVKEDLVPAAADGWLFRLAPYVAFCGTFVAFIALPFADGWSAYTSGMGVFAIGVLFMLAVLSTEVFGVILAGCSSGNKWALYGGMREAAQMVSYEVPMALCVLVPVLLAGTLDLGAITRQQSGWFFNWFVFHDPFTFVAFWTYFTCAVASCKRAPFDLAEAESELVAGFHTEYSGLRWAFFFMAEYGTMFAVSGIATHLFLGGWNLGLPVWSLFGAPADLAAWLPWPHPILSVGNLLNAGIFTFKCFLLVTVMMWLRWTLPRIRIDQVMSACLIYLLPISCVVLMGVCLWQLFVPPWWRIVVAYSLAAGWIVFVLAVGVRLFSSTSQFPQASNVAAIR